MTVATATTLTAAQATMLAAITNSEFGAQVPVLTIVDQDYDNELDDLAALQNCGLVKIYFAEDCEDHLHPDDTVTLVAPVAADPAPAANVFAALVAPVAAPAGKPGQVVRNGKATAPKSATTHRPGTVVRNGVRLRNPATVAGAMWAYLDANPTTTIKQLLEHAAKVGWNAGNCKCEIYRWKTYNKAGV